MQSQWMFGKSEVQIIPDLTSVQDKDAGRYTITFRTLDDNLQLLPTNNQVVITDSDACKTGQFCLAEQKTIPPVVVSGANGEYSFTHTYKDGLNSIEITSASPGIQSSTQDFVINLFPSGSSGPGTGSGSGSDSGLPVGMIVTALIVLGGLVLFIIVLRKKEVTT